MKLNLKALVLAAGLVWAGAVLMVAVTNLIWPGYGTTFLHVVASIYPGYDASGSIGAVIVGTVYALIDGAIFGLVFGWLYNWFLSKRSPA
jgi:membrane associated rhomboid family serine protease